MGRDLLYKPAVPFQLPDEEEGEGKEKVNKGQKAGATKKVERSRELGSVGVDPRLQAQLQKSLKGGKPRAFENAYFNQDVSSTSQANLASKPMQALRGGEGATDLRQVVIPGPAGDASPSPQELGAAGELMGLDGSLDTSMQGLLQRHGGWLQGKGVTADMIKARLEQLEQMVADRVNALARMGKGRSNKDVTRASLVQAMTSGGEALQESTDLATEGSALVQSVEDEAEGMHQRLAKTLGLKRRS